MHSVRAACTLDAVRQRRGQCCDDDDGDATAAARSEATAAWQALSTALSRVARGFGDDDATATAIASRVIAGDERVAWAAALRRVADTATYHRIALAQLLTRALFDAFAPALQRFARAMVRSTHDMHTTAFARASHGRHDVGDDRMRCACVALRRLYDDYVRVQPLLHDMDECLHAPGATDEFTALLRGALLQPDVASGAPSPVTVALLAFVRAHAHALLAQHDRRNRKSNHDNDDDNDDSNDDDDNNDDDNNAMMTTTTHEAVLRCLHGLTLSSAPSVRRVWRETLSRCLDARVAAALASSDYAVPHLQACLAWTSSVVESFVRQTLATPSATASSSSSRMRYATRCGHARPRRDRSSSCDDDDGDAGAVMAWRGWRVRVRQMLLHHYARLRMANVWDVLVDYPDSLPALAELRCCLQACGHRGRALQRRLVRTLRDVLATRLHCAGTRTEHVVVVLCKTVQSLCALLPRSEQSAVIFDVVSDTLRQLRARADSVATVVRCIADVSSDTSLFRTRVDDAAAAATSTTTVSAAAMAASMAATHGLDDDDGSSSSKASSDVDDDDDDDNVSDADGRHDANNNNSSSSSSMATAGAIDDVHRRPDVLRVLLTAVPARLLTHEYARVLAEQLLSRAPHSFDTTLAEEVHERLRCVLGQHALRSCGVMLQDIQHSRRVTQQLREYAVVVATKATTTTTRRRRRRPPSSSSRPYDDERHGQRDGSGSDGERSGSEETGRGAMCIGTPVAMTAAVSPSSPLSRTATTRASTGHGYTKTNSSSSDDDEDDDGGSDVSRIQASVDVLSLSAWPRLASLQARMAAAADAASRASLRRGSSVARHEQPTRALSYTPHPLLHRYMAQLARGYAAVKARRTLVWLLAHCRVELELLQQQQQQQQQQMPAPPPTATRPTSSSAAASSSCVWAPHTLSLLAASIVLWVRDLSSSSEATTTEQETTTTARRVRVCDVAERLGVSLAMLQPHVRALMPTVLVDCGVVRDDDESGSEAACVALQTHVVATMTTTTTATTTTTTIASPSSTMVCFDDLVAPQPSSTSMHARAAATAHTAASTMSLHDSNNDNGDDDGEVVAGVSAAQLRMLELMVPARLKTCDGATTLSEIHNSMKRFAQFTGTAADMRKILQRFVAQGKLSVSADGKLYTLPTA